MKIALNSTMPRNPISLMKGSKGMGDINWKDYLQISSSSISFFSFQEPVKQLLSLGINSFFQTGNYTQFRFTIYDKAVVTGIESKV